MVPDIIIYEPFTTFKKNGGKNIMKTPISRIAALVKDDEEAMNVINVLTNPSKDRATLGRKFEEILGYDPDKWITKIELNGILDRFVSESGRDIEASRENIITTALEIIDEKRYSFELAAVKEAMERTSIDENIVKEFADLYLVSDFDIIDNDDEEEIDFVEIDEDDDNETYEEEEEDED